MKDTVLYVVIPCYNEEEVLPETLRQMTELLRQMAADGTVSAKSRLLFVDDGSRDATWDLISAAAEREDCVCGIKLAHNAGHQNALLAGLMTAKECCDCCVSMDADLQDDIAAIPRFVSAFEQGNDIVYGVRIRRETDSGFKRLTAKWFYRMMRFLGADVIENHADYRLMSRRALSALAEFSEVNLFLRGVVRLVGFPNCEVGYERRERIAGKSKYPLKKMLSFAFDGISSFSIRPIRLVWSLGLLACLMAAWMMGKSVGGWTSLMISIWFLGGVQLVSVGVIGEYIGKIYREVKRRPRYIIEEMKKVQE